MRFAIVLLAVFAAAPAAETAVPPETPLAARVYRHPAVTFGLTLYGL